MNKKFFIIVLVIIIVIIGGCLFFFKKATAPVIDKTEQSVLQSNEIKSNFQYSEIVKEKIGINGGILQNMEKSVVVTIPQLKEETEFILSFKKSDFEVKSGIRSPIIINISPDIDFTNLATPIKIKIKYDAKYNLPVGYLINEKNKLQSVNIGELDKENHYFTIYTFHGGDYSWVYAN
jgi:hypothetical protein